MIVSSLDKKDVEITFCDAGYAPGSKPGQLLNTSVPWFKVEGGEWMRSKYRSAIITASHVKRTNAADLYLHADIPTLPNSDPKPPKKEES